MYMHSSLHMSSSIFGKIIKSLWKNNRFAKSQCIVSIHFSMWLKIAMIGVIDSTQLMQIKSYLRKKLGFPVCNRTRG